MNYDLIFVGGEDVSARIDIYNHFHNKGMEILIVGSEESKKFEELKIPFAHYNLEREASILKDMSSVFELRKILKKVKNNVIVNTFDTKPAYLVPIACTGIKNIKVVRTITGIGRIFSEDKIKFRITRLLFILIHFTIRHLVRYTVFQNKADQEYFTRLKLCNSSNSTIIKSSGIDLRSFNNVDIDQRKINNIEIELKLNKTKKTFIMVSRIIKQKGVLTYLEAAKKCNNEFNFLLVGSIDSNETGIPIDEINNFSRYVKYLGPRNDVKELLSLSDIFVLPTYYREGIPRVLLEAATMNLGIITTDMPGCNDFILDRINGLLIKPKDTDQLYEAMLKLAYNKKMIDDFNEYNKNYLNTFSLENVANQYYNLYYKLR